MKNCVRGGEEGGGGIRDAAGVGWEGGRSIDSLLWHIMSLDTDRIHYIKKISIYPSFYFLNILLNFLYFFLSSSKLFNLKYS